MIKILWSKITEAIANISSELPRLSRPEQSHTKASDYVRNQTGRTHPVADTWERLVRSLPRTSSKDASLRPGPRHAELIRPNGSQTSQQTCCLTPARLSPCRLWKGCHGKHPVHWTTCITASLRSLWTYNRNLTVPSSPLRVNKKTIRLSRWMGTDITNSEPPALKFELVKSCDSLDNHMRVTSGFPH